MPITAADLRWFQSERMTDEDDGGGRMTGTEILFGAENQIFDDISDVDRAAGDASIRKVYAAVASADDDKYLDAGIVVMRPPADPDVSVLAFSTGDFFDERLDAQNRLQGGVARGPRWRGYLWGQHFADQRSLLIWQPAGTDAPVQGQRFDLAAYDAGAETHSQMVWVTGVVVQEVTIAYGDVSFDILSITLEIAEALQADYQGVDPLADEPGSSSLDSRLYEARYVPDAVDLVGIRPLVEAAGVGDYTVRVDDIYDKLIPTALVETALPDATPGGDSQALVGAASGTIQWQTSLDVIEPGGSLFLGGPVMPGTLSISVSGSAISDQGGDLYLGTQQIGTIDYGNGVCRWLDACPDYGTAVKTITYKPAAAPLRVADSASQAVTIENRGYVWTITLSPIPAPGTLRVSYRANGVWYQIWDDGSGTLRGSDSSHGSGTLTFSTGTVVVTTGAIPDPESEILYTWGVPVSYTARGGDAVAAPKISGQLANAGVAPGTVSFDWTVGVDNYSLTDDGAGNLTGTGGTGVIRYPTGEWEITPNVVPPAGTEIDIQYDHGPPVLETFVGPTRDGNGHVPLALTGVPRAGSVEVEWDLAMTDLGDQQDIDEEFVPPQPDPLISPLARASTI